MLGYYSYLPPKQNIWNMQPRDPKNLTRPKLVNEEDARVCREIPDEACREVPRNFFFLIGSYVLSHGYYDAYYLQAQRIRRLIAQDFRQAFEQCDVIMGPVAPTVAWNIGEKKDDPVANYLADIFTLSTNLAGLPGMSIPCGFGQGEPYGHRPVGLQLTGNYFDEARLLNVAHQFQQATDWHLRAPSGV